MSGSERLDSKAGPLGNVSQAYFGSLDVMAKGFEPALKGVARWNLELASLMARRSQAWLAVPARLMQCRTPVDLLSEQMRFWQSAAADYTEGSRRLGAAWGSCTAMAKLNGTQPRDYMTFDAPKDAQAVSGRGDRRAA